MIEADEVAQAIIVSEEADVAAGVQAKTKQTPGEKTSSEDPQHSKEKMEVRSSTPNASTHNTATENKSSTETSVQETTVQTTVQTSSEKPESKLNGHLTDESPENMQSSAQSSTQNSSPISVQDSDKISVQNSVQNSAQNSTQNTAQNASDPDSPKNDDENAENGTEPPTVSAKNETQHETTQRHSSVKQRNSNDRKLFVGALGWTTTDKHLFEYFKEYGEVEDVECKIDQQTNRCRGFGFVLFKEQSSVDAVLSENEHKINGKKVDPKYAVEQKRDGKIFVGGLRSETTDEAVKSYFETFGPVENIERPYDKHQGKAKGFAFITFTEDNIISKVVVEKYHEIEGKRCEVKEAVPSELNTGYETNNYRNEYSRDNNGYPRNDYNRNEQPQRNDYGRNDYNNRENNKPEFNRPDYSRPENSGRPNFNRNDNYNRPDYNRDNRTDNFNRNPDSNNYNRSSMNPRPQFNRNDYSRQNSGGPRGPPQFINRPRHQGPQIRPIRNHNNAYQPRGGAGQLPNRAPIPRTQPRLASPRFPVRNMQPGTQFQVPPQVHMHRTYNPLNPMLVNPGVGQISHNTQMNGTPTNAMQPQNSQIPNIHMPITAHNLQPSHAHQNMTLNPQHLAQNIGVPGQIPVGLIQNAGIHNTGMHMNPSLLPSLQSISSMNPTKLGMHPHFSTQIHPSAQIPNGGQIHNGQLINGALRIQQAYSAGQISTGNVQFLPDASSTTVLSNPDDIVEKISARVQSVDLNDSKNSNLQEEHLAGSLGNLNLNGSLNNSNINTSNLNSSNLNPSNLNSSNLNSSAINPNTLNSTINSAVINAPINVAINSGTINSGTINSVVINPNNQNMPGSIPTTINSTTNSVLNSGAVNSNSTTPAATAPVHVPISPLPGSNVEIYNHYTHNQQPQHQPQQTQLATVPTIANPNFISQLAQQQAFQQILNSQVLQQQHHHHQQQPQQQLNISNRLIEEQLAHAHLLQRTQLSASQALGQPIRPNMPLQNLVQNSYSANHIHPTANPLIPGMQALLPGQQGGGVGIMHHPHHHPHLHAHQNLAHQSLPQQHIQSHQHLQQHHNLPPHQNLTHHPGAAAQQVQNTHPGTHHRQQINQHVQQHPTPNHSNSPQAGGQVYGQPRFVNRGVRPYGDRNFNQSSGRGRGGHTRPQGRGPYNSYNRQDSGGSKFNEARR